MCILCCLKLPLTWTGIRMLDGVVTDKLESLALCYNLDKIHIFTCSWGPSDNGGTVEAPGRLAEKCFIKGVTDVRPHY